MLHKKRIFNVILAIFIVLAMLIQPAFARSRNERGGRRGDFSGSSRSDFRGKSRHYSNVSKQQRRLSRGDHRFARGRRESIRNHRMFVRNHRKPDGIHRRFVRVYNPYPFYGTTLIVLPTGFVTTSVGGVRYFYHSGIFYKRAYDGYVAVAPPIGAVISTLPPDCHPVVIGGVRYFTNQAAYYRHTAKGYEVISQPRGRLAMRKSHDRSNRR